MFGLARKATLDMRLIDPSIVPDEGSKLDQVVKRVTDIWKESTPKLGTQLVFADLYQSPEESRFLDPSGETPNPAYGKPRFMLFDELKKKLVEAGIPAEQIGVILDAKTPAQRENLFNKVQAGIVRVLIGTSERMGVGVNVQNKIVALHHLDAPPRPMDVEQRNGRAIRRGNENPVVELLNYGVENTLDAAMYISSGWRPNSVTLTKCCVGTSVVETLKILEPTSP